MKISFCIVTVVLFASSVAAADETKAPPGAQTKSTTTAVIEKEMLANIKPGASSSAAQGAGGAREVKLESKDAAAAKTLATPRLLRRMKSTEAIAGIQPALAQCAAKNPSATATTIPLRMSVSGAGAVEKVEVSEGTKVPAALLACVKEAAKTAQFTAPGGTGSLVVTPVIVPAK